jgi:hypothetical protein
VWGKFHQILTCVNSYFCASTTAVLINFLHNIKKGTKKKKKKKYWKGRKKEGKKIGKMSGKFRQTLTCVNSYFCVSGTAALMNCLIIKKTGKKK